MTDVDKIIEYYVDLLIIQYNGLPKASAQIRAEIKAILADAILIQIRDGYDIETAVGVQLDVIGKYVGVDRFFSAEDYDGYFALTAYNEVVIPSEKRGFSTYTNYNTSEGRMLTYDGVITKNNKLLDDDYRQIIKLKIILNNINFSHEEIDEALDRIFSDNIIADTVSNKSMDFFVSSSQDILLQAVIAKKLLPVPMGTFARYLILSDGTLFGLTDYNDTQNGQTGFTTYLEYDTKEGRMLGYDNLIAI